MTTTVQPQPRTQAFAGVILGIVALVIITALFAAAGSAVTAAHEVRKASDQIETVRDAQAERDRIDHERQQGTLKARATLMHQNEVLAYQNRVLQEYLKGLTRLLRREGIDVPTPPKPGSSSTRPKAEPPTSRGTPTPTAPGQRSPDGDCLLIPPLCGLPLSIPTLLP